MKKFSSPISLLHNVTDFQSAERKDVQIVHNDVRCSSNTCSQALFKTTISNLDIISNNYTHDLALATYYQVHTNRGDAENRCLNTCNNVDNPTNTDEVDNHW